MNSFVQRVLTAIVFVSIMLGGVLFESTYVILMALITAFCTHEFLDISAGLRDDRPKYNQFYRFALITVNVLTFLLTASMMTWQLDGRYIAIIPALLFTFFIAELYSKSEKPLVNIAINMSGFVYVGIPFAMLNFVVFHKGEYASGILIGILALVWIYDSAAYIFGNLFGSRPLFKRISPNKTVEGLLGGLLVLTAVGFGLGYVFKAFTPFQWAVISGIIAYFSAIGDLVESMIKRSLNIKDTGDIMPGHGGFLDRFDAFIFVIPFIAFYIICFAS
jgi:phosphatidate cytidylyltransferase